MGLGRVVNAASDGRPDCPVGFFKSGYLKKHHKSCIKMLFDTLLQGKLYSHGIECLQELVNDSGYCSLGISEPLTS